MEQYGGETTFFFIARVTAQTQTFWESIRDDVRSIQMFKILIPVTPFLRIGLGR